MVYLTMGPWYHGQEIGEGRNTRRDPVGPGHRQMVAPHVLAPFLAHYLKERADGRGAGDGVPVGRQPVAAAAIMAGGRAGRSALYLKPGDERSASSPRAGAGADRRLLCRIRRIR